MTTTFEHLLEHKAATDATDRQLVYILCKFIDNLDEDGHLPHDTDLFGFVVDELSQPPGDVLELSHFCDERFTDEDRDTIIELLMEEIHGDVKQLAHDRANDEPLLDLVILACHDSAGVAQFLQVENADREAELCEEYGHEEDIAKLAIFATRMGLMLDDGTITELGQAFIERNAE